MKKKRAIIIENEKLRRIWNSIRDIILQAIIEEINRLTKANKLITEKFQNKDWIKKGKERDLEIKKLSDMRDKFHTSWKKSIMICPVCGSRTNNITFNPLHKSWLCTESYTKNQEFYKKRGEGYLYP